MISTVFEKRVNTLLGELAPRARNVLKKRYGLGEKEALTLEAIGKKEGITRERVRQIENDALSKLKKSGMLSDFVPEEKLITEVIRSNGGVISESGLAALPEFASVRDKKYLLFFLDLCGGLVRRKESDNFAVRWCLKDAPIAKIEQALNAVASELTRDHEPVTESEVVKRADGALKKVGVDVRSSGVLKSLLAISKHIERNKWGEYGHVSSPFVRPKGMRDGAYVALSRAKKPLHFRDIAKHIQEFMERNVHVQTVHNELIKDARFVLVGRGLYGLADWGYQPGFIRDVVVKVLKEHGPLTRDQIVDRVLQHRQVKPATVLINLQNRKMFQSNSDGTYTLLS